MNRIIFLTTFILAIAFGKVVKATADDECFNSIAKSIETGNHSSLALKFAPNVECDILGNSSIYSKAHASLIMKDFFSKNKPNNFEILHKVRSDPKFIIGAYKSTNGQTFKLSCFVKYDESRKEYLIYQIRVE